MVGRDFYVAGPAASFLGININLLIQKKNECPSGCSFFSYKGNYYEIEIVN